MDSTSKKTRRQSGFGTFLFLSSRAFMVTTVTHVSGPSVSSLDLQSIIVTFPSTDRAPVRRVSPSFSYKSHTLDKQQQQL